MESKYVLEVDSPYILELDRTIPTNKLKKLNKKINLESKKFQQSKYKVN